MQAAIIGSEHVSNQQGMKGRFSVLVQGKSLHEINTIPMA